MPDAFFESVPTPSEIRVAGVPISVTSPKANTAEYLQGHPQIAHHTEVYGNFLDMQDAVNWTPVQDIPRARLEIADFATAVSQGRTRYEDVMHPDILGAVVSLGNELLMRNKLSWNAVVEGVNRPEVLLEDYLAGTDIKTAEKVFGRESSHTGLHYTFLSPEERTEVFPFILRLKQYSRSFPDSVDHVSQLISAAPMDIPAIRKKMEDLHGKMVDLLTQESSETRNGDIEELIDKFTGIRSEQTKYLSHFIIEPFSRLACLLEHSQFNEVNTDDRKTMWQEVVGPWGIGPIGDSPEDRFRETLRTMERYTEALPQLPDFISTYIEAARVDAESLGIILDRRSGESDDAYVARMQELTNVTWSDTQKAFMEFAQRAIESGEVNTHPEIMLEKISELCGIPLEHAQMTPTQRALMSIAAGFAMQNYMGTGEEGVYMGQPKDRVLRKLILIHVPETNRGYEWRFTDGDCKSYVDTEQYPNFLTDNWPINQMSKEQYAVFMELIDVIQYVE